MENLSVKKISKMIDHTKLSADANFDDIKKLCDEAVKYDFFSVCVNPFYIKECKRLLENSDVKVCTVIGFPLGQNTIETKVFETRNAIINGADEIDMVINIPKLKEGDVDYCINEINQIKKACGNMVLKVIVETCLLTNNQKELAANIVLKSDADFIKTSTGFSIAGATFMDIEIFKSVIGDKKMIKAAGGIKTITDLLKMIEFGADRIGTSRGVELIKEFVKGTD